MSTAPAETIFADAVLNAWLAGVGLAVEYVRAEGNTLYYRDDRGDEVAVLDLLCGFGSLIFGHHHPEIVAHAKAALDAGIPVHAQLSKQPHGNQVGAALNAIVRRETGRDDRYTAVFANSGAEAIEICMKHAELERRDRVRALMDEVAEHLEQARRAVRGGAATAAAAGSDDAGAVGDPVERFEALAAEVSRRNAELLGRPPLFLALEGAFHGKLVGSIQLTQNEQWRAPFAALAPAARFLPAADPEAFAKAVASLREYALDVIIDAGKVRLVERDFPLVGALFVEPVRGGAGMRPVTAALAREIERTAATLGCPVVVDEVQSGMGRTGAFLASSHMGLRGDYYTLAKSIGGGIAKNSVVLVRQDRFRPEFEVIHSSTFAKDGFSGAIALKTLEMLEANDGEAYRVAAERGGRLAVTLAAVQADFPDVVTGVHGIGLMLAMELAEQSESASEVIREPARAGFLGYFLAGYLLRRHRIRVLPAGPAWNSVRFEPSIYLTDQDIERIDIALRAMCSILRSEDGGALL
ncbi:aminotransferase class III-fold pyridoxal phosphate-dependent enzyme [Parafrankia sp. FMc2]|uniref:aminotransferase class III-fold pyridoxal phosphate-dependent enzyme n=1 Tax=Parafrankia sp. FMc2 TaxID=3233196 RepID=UPI0034D6B387